MLLLFLLRSLWCATNTRLSDKPQREHFAGKPDLINIFLYSWYAPPFHRACLGPTNVWLRQTAWQDLLQKNFPLFELCKSRGLFHVSFPQISQGLNSPFNWAVYWHFLEQYFPQPFFNQLGFAYNKSTFPAPPCAGLSGKKNGNVVDWKYVYK